MAKGKRDMKPPHPFLLILRRDLEKNIGPKDHIPLQKATPVPPNVEN